MSSDTGRDETNQALSTVVLSLGDNPLSFIQECAMAKDVWAILNE